MSRGHTDRERLIELLKDFGVHFEEVEAKEWWPGQHAVNEPPYPRPDNPEIIPAHITIPSRGGPKNDGYDGFECTFYFDDDGTFEEVVVEE